MNTVAMPELEEGTNNEYLAEICGSLRAVTALLSRLVKSVDMLIMRMRWEE